MDKQKRNQLLEESALCTPVAGMRTSWGLISAYWKSEEKMKASAMAGVMIGLTFLETYLNIGVTFSVIEMGNAAMAKDLPQTCLELAKTLGFCTGASLANGMRDYMGHQLHMGWRGWLTQKFSESWLANNAFYHIKTAPGTIDNPDQRIAEDTSSLPGHLIGLGMGAMTALSTLASYTVILAKLSDFTHVNVLNSSIAVPGSSFWIGFGATIGYAFLGTAAIYLTGKKLPFLNDMNLERDATYRASLLKIIEHAREIAATPEHPVEKRSLTSRFNEIRDAWRQRSLVQAKLMTATTFYSLFGNPVSLGIAGIMSAFTAAATTTGGLVGLSRSVDQLRISASWFINVFQARSDVKTRIHRLTSAARDIEDSRMPQQFYERRGLESSIIVTKTDGDKIIVRDLVLNAEKSTILKVDALEICPGERVLVSGASGSGKSTLMNATMKAHICGIGHVEIPENKKCFFATQHPLLKSDLTLKENVAYPEMGEKFSDDDVKRALSLAALEYLVPFLHEKNRDGLPWESLSGGEKQRMIFARIFLQRPDIIFLDEATASLDPALQSRMYATMIDELPRSSITSIAHRFEIARFHNRHLFVQNGTLYEKDENVQILPPRASDHNLHA